MLKTVVLLNFFVETNLQVFYFKKKVDICISVTKKNIASLNF